MPDRIYATLAEVIYDLDLNGVADEAEWLKRLRAASDWLDKRLGGFIPKTETKRLDGPGGKILFTPPLLAVTTLIDDATTLTTSDYLLYPRARHWENGPYTHIEIDPDATALTTWTKEADIVTLTGRWGKYEESVATGATVANATQIAAAGTALQVADGSKLAVGMVLLIGSEQLLVEATGALTASVTTTSEALDASEEGVDVASGAALNVGEIIRVDSESMKVTAIDTNTLTVKRGWNGTPRAAHTTSAAVGAYRTYTVKRGVNGTTDAAHLNGVAISRYIAPGDVNWLARQICGLMHKKAQGGFAGKSGSVDLGTIFYHDEFPREAVKEIERNYRIVNL